jgi:D-glycero-D-manno-heptose 1,7-bisphosphate phosphatase
MLQERLALIIDKNPISAPNRNFNKALFLDRDGVVNEIVIDGVIRGARNLQELQIRSEIISVVKKAKKSGYMTIVVTNQPDLADGTANRIDLDLINQALFSSIPDLDYIATCPHLTSENCSCKKPRAGLIVHFANEFSLNLSESLLIGDRWVDIQAGVASGVRTILLNAPYSWKGTSAGEPSVALKPNFIVHSSDELDALLNQLMSNT